MKIDYSKVDTSEVTDEQIGMVWKIFVGSIPFWRVHSESDPFKTYTVTYSQEHGYTCTCRCGEAGFSTCQTWWTCKHVRWVIAQRREEAEYMDALRARDEAARDERERRICAVVVDGKRPDPGTQARIELANEKAASTTRKGGRQAAGRTVGFSLMR